MVQFKINPEPYIRFLLEEPNPLMTGQMFQEKMAVQLELNHNAFAYINVMISVMLLKSTLFLVQQ